MERNVCKKGNKEEDSEALVAKRIPGGRQGQSGSQFPPNSKKPRNPPPQARQSSNFSPRVCYHFRESGHVAANCEKNKDRNKKCNRCGKMGHVMSNCKTKPQNFAQASGHYSQGTQERNGNTIIATIEGNAPTSVGSMGQNWVIDSGAPHHMCNDKNAFQEMEELENPIRIRVGNNEKIEATHIGNVSVPTKVKGLISNANLQKVLYALGIGENLLSVSICTSFGNKVVLRGNGVSNFNPNGDLIGSGFKNGGLYLLERNLPEGQGFLAQGNDFQLWHSRLGHLNGQSLKMLKNQELVRGLEEVNFQSLSECEVCAMGKMSKLPTSPLENGIGTKMKLELIHTDVVGPIGPIGINGSKYFVTFIDDFTRKAWVYLMRDKSEVLKRFHEFLQMVNNKGEEKVQQLWSDNGGEYKNEPFLNFCKSKGIEFPESCSFAPNQKGVAERYNRTIVETTRCMLQESGLTLRLWPQALLTTVHIRNRCPHNSLEGKKTPDEAWSGFKPSIKHLRKWGCKVSVLIPKQLI